MLAIKFKPPIIENRRKQGENLTISRSIFEIIDSNNFWENLLLLIEIYFIFYNLIRHAYIK
jgi:hypothetical protein